MDLSFTFKVFFPIVMFVFISSCVNYTRKLGFKISFIRAHYRSRLISIQMDFSFFF